MSQSNIPGVPFTFTLQQTGTAVTGTATYGTGTQTTGTVSGTELNNQFDVVITWPTGSPGRYTATVTPGQMINGDTYPLSDPNFHAQWSATGTTGCSVPTSKDQCKDGGWNNLTTAQGAPFKNQGDCDSYVASDGKSDPHTS